MKILLLDNYDSFTYNLAHYLRDIVGVEIPVKRNDQITLKEIGQYDAIVLSPGPGLPDDAGVMKEAIRLYGTSKKILGVCLGMQAIGEVYGGSLRNLDTVFHGIATPARTTVEDEPLFQNLGSSFAVGRYHSWVVNRDDLPANLEITAVDEQGEIMALRHKTLDVRGVQFHPESILTPGGLQMLKNWIGK